MDIQKGLPLNWTYFYQEKIMEDVRQSQLLSMELEETRLKAEEELRFRDEQIIQLKDMLTRAIKERERAQENCQAMFLEKLLLQQQLQCHPAAPDSGVSSLEDEHPATGGMNTNNGFSSPDSDESIVSSPPKLRPPQPPQEAELELELELEPEPEPELPFVPDMPLPQKGRLLEAVMKAGPLLQTLLLAGPLPQWRHPPPPLDHYQIPPPPVVIPSSAALPTVPPAVSCQQLPLHGMVNCGRMSRKRALSESSDASIDTKSRRELSSATPTIDESFKF